MPALNDNLRKNLPILSASFSNHQANQPKSGKNQWGLHGGKCGVCGDPYQGPRQNEAGGKYANGIIVRNYARGQEIEVKVEITANHKGWFEFRLCLHNSPRTRISQQCLNQHLLHITGHGTRFTIPTTLGVVALRVQLPPEVTCRQCVLQWKWHSGNNWGTDRQTRQGCLGCGPQEEFYGCSDVSIGGDNGGGGLILTETSGSNGVNSLNVGTRIKEGRDSTDTRVSRGHAEADVEEKLRTESHQSRTVVRGR
ncbi:uncharacterized protein LOC106165573, partial [Lingula anatina]|uniref:Uncharacterized protein LOC106165573 n=1 Tax=Lingula anatina TaxID=7574 RepID=A0A1S3IP14_LINAN